MMAAFDVAQWLHALSDIHVALMVLCLLVFAVVFVAMLYSIVRLRRVRGRSEDGTNFHGSMTVEVVWLVVPFLIMIGMAVPATRLVFALSAG
ncbi:cytochrome c oxidase subunit II transmembrane domain-containing protein [Robbsia sp. KACC 23696]|uniref:cytochrome c oxidase subunit II transmembrane domain-containing protein n=1 Tax=Robbsia sp. KACC 23696 TaxID=3149231 RepID=UPI00325AF498